MRRLLLTVICVLGIVPTATAVELTAVGSTTLPMVSPGELVTIEFNLTNMSQDSIIGLGISAYDYDGFDFVEGSAVGDYLNTVCLTDPPILGCIGGLSNLAGGALAESSLAGNGDRVEVALSGQIGAVSNPGLGIDQGLDGQVGSVMFSVTFRAVEFGVIRVGSGYLGDGFFTENGELNPLANELLYTFVPEPGTALLIGLGLAGLSTSGKRRHPRVR